MPYKVPLGYPDQLTTDKLNEVVSSLQNYAAEEINSKQGKSGLVDYKHAIDIGQNELSLRFLRQQSEINTKARNTSYFINGVSILMLIASLWIASETKELAESDQQSDEEWRKEQLDALIENNSQLQEMNKRLTEIPLVILPDSLDK